MGRAPCCDKANVKRGPWTPDEDNALKNYIEKHGNGGNWIVLPRKAGLKRCGKSCRLRWLNYLRPDIKHGGFSQEEDNIICSLYSTLGSRWSFIASQLQGRTDNDIKNYWNTKLKKKLLAGKIALDNNNRPNYDYPAQVLDQIDQFSPPGLMEYSPSTANNNYSLSSSQKASSLPSSNSFPLEFKNNYADWSCNGGSEDLGMLLDLDFEVDPDYLFSGSSSQERNINEVTPWFGVFSPTHNISGY